MKSKGKDSFTGHLLFWCIVIVFAAAYMINFELPLNNSNYTTGIWGWAECGVCILAVIGIVKTRYFSISRVITAFILGGICYFSILLNVNFTTAVSTALPVIICYYGGCAYFSKCAGREEVSRFDFKTYLKQICLGLCLALPFAAVNTAYFVLQGGIQFISPLNAAVEALNPGISEEIIFRFAVLGFCSFYLKERMSECAYTVYSCILMVIPHSLIHLPDAILESPASALFLFITTCLIFGLPMAVLMKKKGLRSAVAFHWCIDFMRFLFGY